MPERPVRPGDDHDGAGRHAGPTDGGRPMVRSPNALTTLSHRFTPLRQLSVARPLSASACLVAMLALLLLPGRWYLLMWLPFAAGARLVLGLHRRTAIALVLLGGAALPLIAALHPPNSSDDMYRYIW